MRTPVGRETTINRQTHAEGAVSELKRRGIDPARCRTTRKLLLQLLAAATAINLERLLSAQDARSDGQTGDRAPDLAVITALTGLLTRCLAEISRLTATDSSTGS